MKVHRSRLRFALAHARVTSELPGLPDQLLGNVLLADIARRGRRLRLHIPGCRVVTRAGELLEPDGTLTVGPPKAEAGLVSRKSELRELREQFRALTEQVAITGVELAELRRRADAADGMIEAVESEIALLSGEAGDLQQKIARQRQQVEQLDETIELGRQEADILEQEVQRGEAAWVAAKLAAEEAERGRGSCGRRLAELQESHAGGRSKPATRRSRRTPPRRSRSAAPRPTATAPASGSRSSRPTCASGGSRRSTSPRPTAPRAPGSPRARSPCSGASAGQAEAYREKEHRERLAAELAREGRDRPRRPRARPRRTPDALRTGWQEQAGRGPREGTRRPRPAIRAATGSRRASARITGSTSRTRSGAIRSQETGVRRQKASPSS